MEKTQYKIRLLKINTHLIECFSFDTMEEFTKKLREIIDIAEHESKYVVFCRNVDDLLCSVGENSSSKILEDEIPVVGIGVDNQVFEPTLGA